MATGTLTGTTIAATYKSILKVKGGANNVLDADPQLIEDGDGNDSVLGISTDSVLISGSGTRLDFNTDGSGEYISGDGTDLTIGAGSDIHLTATNDVNIPVNVGLRFGDGGENIETDNTSLTITAATASALVLDANSRISLSNNDSGTSNTIFGYDAGASLDAGSNYNVFIGHQVADASMNDAVQNVGVGYRALSGLTEGDYNICIGTNAGIAITTGDENVAIGDSAFMTATATNLCVAIGSGAGDAINHADAVGTTAVGAYALSALTSGIGNVAIGYQAMDANLTSDYNTAVGYQALSALNDDGDTQNTAVGYKAGILITTGHRNTIFGANALITDDVGTRATAIGAQALALQNSASEVDTGNTAVGFAAGYTNVTGTNNTNIGSYAGYGNTGSNSNNTAVGMNALLGVTTGSGNTVVGKAAGDSIADGGSNVVIGYGAGDAMTDAGNNVIIGVAAAASGVNFTTGDECVIIGSGADTSSGDAQNQTAIGYDCNAVADDSVTLGNASVTAVYMASDKGATVYAAAEYLYNSTAAEVEFIRMYLTNTTSSNGSCAASITAYGDRTNGGGTREVAKIKFAKEQQWVADPPASNDASIGFWCQLNETLTEHLHIAADGTMTGTDTDGTSSISDSRLKENVDDYEGGLDIINQLRPVTFDYINPKQHQSGTRRGFLAQEVQEVDDYWVGEIEIAEFLEDGLEEIEGEQEAKARSKNPDYDLCEDTDYISLTSKLNAKDAMYIGAIKELLEKIETLESKVSALEG